MPKTQLLLNKYPSYNVVSNNILHYPTISCEPGARFTTKNLRKNPKFSISFFLKFVLSYKVKIFVDFYK